MPRLIFYDYAFYLFLSTPLNVDLDAFIRWPRRQFCLFRSCVLVGAVAPPPRTPLVRPSMMGDTVSHNLLCMHPTPCP